ncbi:MAG: DUF4147 domain-containing protein [Rhodothermales bacterium]
MNEQIVTDARAIFKAAVRGVQADVLMERLDWPALLGRPAEAFRRIVVVGMGKAAMAMASVAEAHFGERVAEGVVVVPHGYASTLPYPFRTPRRIETLEAGHPVPDEASADAAYAILDHATRCGEEDLLIVLISGGGTALTTAFAESIPADEGRHVIRMLLESGADIAEMNAVRKKLSVLGGGRLAQAAAPARVLALAISDVPGDDLTVIASGPTVPDDSTFAGAIDILKRYDLWERVADSVQRHLEAGAEGAIPETPRAGDPIFERTQTMLIGRNRDAIASACLEATSRGYRVSIVDRPVTGEARKVGEGLVADLDRHATDDAPHCVLWGGETTVKVVGRGRGGRNQELALGAALALEGRKRPVLLLSAGTDGVDGPTDAAGAWVTTYTAEAARHHRLDPVAHLDNNDTFPFFERMNALLQPGPTHTNVMDVMIALQPAP